MAKKVKLILVALMETTLLSGCSISSIISEVRQETIKTEPSDIVDFLTIQLQSNNYKDWNNVAICDYATEEHLLIAAQKCTTIPYSSNKEKWAKTVATSICKNPAATGKVIQELSNTNYFSVLDIAAQSTYADEEALIAIAKRCAKIAYDPTKEKWTKTVATSVCKTPAITNKVLRELASSNFSSVIAIAHNKLEELQ